MSLIRITANYNKIKLVVEPFVPTYWNLNTVRWGRKPRWLPTAPSKVFKIKLRPNIPSEETEEIKRLFNNYRTMIKSLNKYFEDKYSVANQVQFDFEQHKKAVDDDFARCSEINNQWNSEQRILREQRVQKELDATLEQAKQRLEARLAMNAEKLNKAEEIVRQQKLASVDFITPDKLDAAIENAFNNPVDYNFSLDVDGTKIWGRETQPSPRPTDEKILRIKQ